MLVNRRTSNIVIDAMTEEDRDALAPHRAELVLEAGAVLYEPGDAIDRLYFPHTSVVSLLTVSPEGEALEGAMIGWEGVVGMGGFLCKETSFTRQVVQFSGAATAFPAKPFRQRWENSASLRRIIHAQRDAFTAQLLQSVTCNAAHTFEERFARWLLTCLDRVDTQTVRITQDFVAALLGVRRPTVTLVARTLQSAGVIDYRRGAVTVVDHGGLEGVACPCYRIISALYEDLVDRWRV